MAWVCGSSSRYLVSFWMILLLQCKTMYSSVPFQVLGPAHPVAAVVGEDLVLQCFLQPNISAEGMTVKWFRLNHQHQEQQGALVHHYRDRRDQNDEQNQPYKGRTFLFKDQLQKGNISLKLSKVQVADEGDYTCCILNGSHSDDVIIQVIVRGIGHGPLIILKGIREDDGNIRDLLVCKVDGWWPEPTLEWLDSNGSLICAEATKKHLGKNGFAVERQLVARERKTDYYVCRLTQKDDRIASQREVVTQTKCTTPDLKLRPNQSLLIPFIVILCSVVGFVLGWAVASLKSIKYRSMQISNL